VVEGTDEAPLYYHLYVTMEEAMIGFLFGSVFGVLFGVALGRNRMMSDVLSVYIKVLNAIPRVVLAPIFILLFGFGLWSKVALSFVMVFFVVFSNAFQGVREADRAMIANAQILGASKWALTRSVIIPSAMSWIFASLHISFGFAIVGAIVGEFIGSRYGIGFIIQTARGVHDTAEMYAAIVIIVVVVLSAEWVMTRIEERLARWRPPALNDTNG
jgi:NitT/TauT family transport system permease protein